MKVIFDTNIWISFLFQKNISSLAQIMTNEKIQVFISLDLIKEIQTVLSRPKFKKINPDSVVKLYELLLQRCFLITNYEDIEIEIRDPNDLFLIRMAHNINPDYLVTGDKDLLILGQYKNTKILTYSEFLNIISS